MSYTINISPMLVTKSVLKLIFVLSNHQICTFPLTLLNKLLKVQDVGQNEMKNGEIQNGN